MSPERLAADLVTLGVRPGVPTMLHASLRRLGPVDGRAAGVIAGVRAALGPEGTLIMMLGSDDVAPFDKWTTPVEPDMGVLAEMFRGMPGVSVSDHAAARAAAIGPAAEGLLEPVPLHHYYGAGSMLERIVAADGQVLRLGANPDTVTLTHYAEYRAQVPRKRMVRRQVERVDLGTQWIESLDDCDGIAQWRDGDYFAHVWHDFASTEAARVGPVGDCTAEVFDAAPFVQYAVAWLERELVESRRLD